VGVLASFACSSVGVLTLLGSPKAHLADRHPTPIEVRPHVCAALAADLADETMLYVGQAKVIGDDDAVAAAIVRARLVQTASLFIAHLACRDCAP
jgi:hypothetical protein